MVAAAGVLRGTIRQTLMLPSRALSELVGGPVYLKCENLQRTGSFKVRGAYMRIARLTDAEAGARRGRGQRGQPRPGGGPGRRGAGHQGDRGHAGRRPAAQGRRDRGYGADVVLHGTCVEEALARARELAAETGSVFIHPFDHPDVIAGQGTVGLEIAEQCPEARTIAVPVGGGGLAVGHRRRGQRPGCRRPG